MNQQFHAFTFVSNAGLFREIVTEIGVSIPFVDSAVIQKEDNRIFHTTALWDTGATNSVITASTASKLGLKPISLSKVFHAGGVSTVNVYLVNIFLPNNLVIPSIRVSECSDASGKFGVIIGMDIITAGDFSITNVGGVTTVSYRLPSIKKIDYVAEANVSQHFNNPISKVGRNDLCPCGSEKKYKNCHGK